MGSTEEWRTVSLAEIAHFASGAAFPKKEQGQATGAYPFYKVSDMNSKGNEVVLTEAANWIDEAQRARLKASVHPAGTVVFPKVGAALKTEKRRLLSRQSVFDNNVMGLVPREHLVLPRFLLALLETIRLGAVAQEGAVPSVNQKTVGEIEIRLPPLREQRRIADLLRVIERTSMAEGSSRDALRQVRQAIIGSVVRSRVESGRWVALRDVVELNPEQLPPELRSGTLRYVDIASVKAGEGIRSEEVRELDWADAPSRARRRIREDDVIVATVRPYLEGFARVTSEFDECIGSTGFCVLRADRGKIDPGFLWAIVCSKAFVTHLTDRQTGSNYPAVRPDDLGSFEFDLPLLSQQATISEQILAIDTALARAADAAVAFRALRDGVLSTLVSGDYAIPPSYDRLIDDALDDQRLVTAV